MISRKQFLQMSAVAGLLGVKEGPVFADASSAPSLTIHPSQHGPLLSPGFLGFSYESAMLSVPDFFTVDNHSLLSLIHRLGPQGVLRIGGNSSDHTFWMPSGNTTLGPKQYSVTPADLQRLAAFVQATGWQVIYGLNLGSGTPEMAAEEAAAVASVLGYSLLAFQIGNEPDLYFHNGLRSSTYTVHDYLTEWMTFADEVQSKVADAPLAGPDASNHIPWDAAMAQRDYDRLVMLSQHHYTEGPGNSPLVTIDRLLQSSAAFEKMLLQLKTISQQWGLPFRITETNSVYSGGKYGVSDTLASALWALEMMCQVAMAGGLGVNFHGGTGGAYSPVVRGLGGVYEPRPLYYALLCFAQIGPGSVVTTDLINGGAGVSAYSFSGAQGRLSLLVINKDAAQDVTISVEPGQPVLQSSVLRLAGPSLNATAGITLGGVPIGAGGAWQPPAGTESVLLTGQQFSLSVPAASAALVSLS